MLQQDAERRKLMKAIGIILIVWGICGIALGTMMYGDIGIACIVGAVTALLSGIGFLLGSRKPKNAGNDTGGISGGTD